MGNRMTEQCFTWIAYSSILLLSVSGLCYLAAIVDLIVERVRGS